LELVLYLVALASERVRKTLTLFVTDWRHQRPLLSGRDLLALGLAPGPVFSELLKNLLAAQLDGQVGSRPAAVDWVRRQRAKSARAAGEKH
jgi:tRNA nucleotidyltransferase (CCA-adding enzyme)